MKMEERYQKENEIQVTICRLMSQLRKYRNILPVRILNFEGQIRYLKDTLDEEIKLTEEKMYNLPNTRSISSPEELGNKLKKIRILRDLKQNEVAAALGIDRSTYTYYETGNITPPVFTLLKLARIFGVEISEILNA